MKWLEQFCSHENQLSKSIKSVCMRSSTIAADNISHMNDNLILIAKVAFETMN